MKKLTKNPFSPSTEWRNRVVRTPNGKLAMITSKFCFFWMIPETFSEGDNLAFAIRTPSLVISSTQYFRQYRPACFRVPVPYRLHTYYPLNDIIAPGVTRQVSSWLEPGNGPSTQTFLFWLFGYCFRKTVKAEQQPLAEIIIAQNGDVTVDGISCGNWL